MPTSTQAARAAPLAAVTLRLFRQDDPFHPLAERRLEEGELVIGRDPGTGWSIPDETRAVSRAHCTLRLAGGRLTLRDTSSNGVLRGPERERLPPGEAVEVVPGDVLRIGDFMLLVEGLDSPEAPVLRPVPAADAGADWPEPEGAGRPSDGSLLDAFCAGARIDATGFAGEDPVEVMRRLGAVYREMVLGLSDLMDERTSVKAEYRMDRTTVGAEGNNPFKWAPAQRVAADLLRPRGEGFLSGPAAVKVSFEDLKKHLLCTMAGLRAAVLATFEALSPEAAQAQVKGQQLLRNREALAFAAYAKLHEDLQFKALEDPESPPNRAFRHAYERQLQELDAMSTRA
ncbi:MAG: type VI secretion system-associated FHA domain protein TagH [Phenylobacterium sp.]|uniref:type VI secretion system-associated FHA domain protein TagH n=1 Tax=Phenylobacterium sp. TaxID=1871053 RepID=UPI003918ECE8